MQTPGGRSLARFRAPLQHRDFRLLWRAQIASELGDALGRVALAVLVHQRTGSALLTGSVWAVAVVPYLGPGQALTAWCERFPKRRALVAADVVRALCFVGMAIDVSMPILFALFLIASTASPPFEAIRSAMTPDTLPEGMYGDGVALMTVTNEFVLLGGYAIGGGIAGAASPEFALAINGLSFGLSALFLARLGAGSAAVDDEGAPVRLRDGWRLMTNDPLALRILLFFPLVTCFALVPEATAAPLVADELNSGPGLVGILVATISVAVLVTTAVTPSRADHAALLRQASWFVVIGAAASASAFLAGPSILWAIVGYTGAGVVFACRVQLSTVLGERLPARGRASAYSVLAGGTAVGQVGAGLGGGALAEAAGAGRTNAFCLTLALAVGTAALVLPPRERRRSTSTEPATDVS